MKNLKEYITERTLGEGWKIITQGSYKACILSFEEPSEEYGIDGGRISKLSINKGKQLLCNYDRGWDVEPKEEVKKFYNEILNKYN